MNDAQANNLKVAQSLLQNWNAREPVEMKVRYLGRIVKLLDGLNDVFNPSVHDLSVSFVSILRSEANPSNMLCACYLGMLDLAKRLHVVGQSPLVLEGSGLTPLHLAGQREDLAMARWLVELRAPIDFVDDNGRTPLFLACALRKPKTVHFLLDSGASMEIASTAGQTPLDVVCRPQEGDDRKLCAWIAARLMFAGANPRKPAGDGIEPRQALTQEEMRTIWPQYEAAQLSSGLTFVKVQDVRRKIWALLSFADCMALRRTCRELANFIRYDILAPKLAPCDQSDSGK